MAQKEITEADLRARVRKLLEEANPDRVDQVTFRGKQYDYGLAWVHFPEGCGGLGISPGMQAVVADEISKHAKTTYEDMAINAIGFGMAAPTLVTHGTEWMKKNLLRRIFTGEDIWCQLFSEPGAGSDVAGLSTRATREGDYWVVNGQKVWTSGAHVSKWGLLLARSNPDVPKHMGMSYFVLDMQSPGVDVRPLHQITGEAEFNEVFMSDVKVPADRIVGREGEGWKVAITTLMNERTAIGGGSGAPRKGSGAISVLMNLWKARDKRRFSPEGEILMRDRITKLYIESELLRLTAQRARTARKAGNPGPEGSVAKLVQAELAKRLWECTMDVIGADSLIYEPGYSRRRPTSRARESRIALSKYQFLRSRANSIEGGTSEVMKNILGERVLGLPGEPRNDKDVPWKQIPRNA
ncbi:MAG TPA: acyl-CoA dehydrogenase family protein [Candidatus Binataceae bacterium]|nr:acyl-CoA dehydrogenase family protein [Candidatus Binataceae bacterium]